MLDDRKRRDAVIFLVQMWNPVGPEPQSLWQVMGRHKDIQYASRSVGHIERQRQIHRLRHVIGELTKHLPEQARNSPECQELAAWGCRTRMHVIRLTAPRLDNEDLTKDIDFGAATLNARRQAGLDDTRAMLARQPWTAEIDPIEGVMIHEALAGS